MKLVLVFFFFLSSANAIAQETVSNKSNPNWESNDDWTAGAPQYSTDKDVFLGHDSQISNDLIVNNTVTIAEDATLIVYGNVSIAAGGNLIVNGDLNIIGSEFQILNGGTLTLNGEVIGGSINGLVVYDGANVAVSGGARLVWYGSWNSTVEGATVLIDGSVNVYGNMDVKIPITGTGSIQVGGELDVQDGGSVFGCSDGGNSCCGDGNGGFDCSLPDGEIETYTSIESGEWSKKETWDKNKVPSDYSHVIISDGHMVTIKGKSKPEVTNVNIKVGAELFQDNKEMKIYGNYQNNGLHTVKKQKLKFESENIILSGTGTIDLQEGNSKLEFKKDVTIQSGSSLFFTGSSNSDGIDLKATLTNYGKVEVDVKTDGKDGVWDNNDGSDLYLYNADFNVEMIANRAFNIVHYSNVGDQEIIEPEDGQYWNLIIGGGGIKKLKQDIEIINFIVINSTLDCDDKDITIGGDWQNKGDFVEREGKVTLTGDNDLELICEQGTENFYDLTVDLTEGNILLFDNVAIDRKFEMLNGNLVGEDKQVTLGNSDFIGELIHSGESFISGTFHRWVNAEDAIGGILFPIGSSQSYFIEYTDPSITEGLLSVDFINDAPGNNGAPWNENDQDFYNTFGDGYYEIIGSYGFVPSTYNIKVWLNSFTGFTMDGIEPLVHRASNTIPWAFSGTHGSNDLITVTRTGLNELGHIALVDDADCQVPAPPTFSQSKSSVCINEEGIVYAVDNPNGNLQFEWNVVHGEIVSGSGTESISVNWGWDGVVGEVEVIAYDDQCGNSPVSRVDVNIEPFTTSPITGRPIVAAETQGVIYSVENNTDYIYNWNVSGGEQVTGGTSNEIAVNWGDAGSGSVSVNAQVRECPLASAEILDVTLFYTYTTQQSGDFSLGSTWIGDVTPIPNANVRISSGHEVFLSEDFVLNNIIIDSAASLLNDEFQMTIDNYYENNGIHDASPEIGRPNVMFNASANNAVVIGKGVLNVHTAKIVSGVWTLDPSSLFTFNANILEIGSSKFDAQGKLRIANDIRLGAGGQFNASYQGSFVQYSSNDPQDIIPTLENYYNLLLKGDGEKALLSNITIDGNLVVEGGELNTNGYAVTLGGNVAQRIESTIDLTFDTLSIRNFSNSIPAIQSNQNILVTNGLNLRQGVLQLNAGKKLIMGENAQIAYASEISFVDGLISQSFASESEAKVIPVGNKDKFGPLEITASNAGSVEVQYFASVFPDTTVDESLHSISKSEYWEVEADATQELSSAKFYFYDTGWSGVTDPSDLRIAGYDGIWSELDPAPEIGTDYIQIANVDQFGPITFASKNGHNPLPIELVYFKAHYLGYNFVRLEWRTATEVNNDFFTVQKASENEGVWVDVVVIPGAGNSSEYLDYMTVDNEPFVGTTYYRLKQTDYDGTYAYSDIQTVFIEDIALVPIYVFPNPANDELTIFGSGLDYNNFKIYNSTGIEVTNRVRINTTNLSFDITLLNAGVYYIKTNIQTLRFVKL